MYCYNIRSNSTPNYSKDRLVKLVYAQCVENYIHSALVRAICRQSLVMSCYLDELIRQVTINCAERGILLLRVRDEIRMTIAAYQTLYESRYCMFSQIVLRVMLILSHELVHV